MMKSIEKLRELCAKWRKTSITPGRNSAADEVDAIADEIQAEYDRAVAAMNKAAGNWAKADAELRGEPPYDELLRCLENDWNIRASWDGLRKFWCIELTEEGVKLRDAELRVAGE